MKKLLIVITLLAVMLGVCPAQAENRIIYPANNPTVVTNLHAHTCAKGHAPYTWWHDDSAYGNVSKHTCPICGRVQWEKDTSRGVKYSQNTIITKPTIVETVPKKYFYLWR